MDLLARAGLTVFCDQSIDGVAYQRIGWLSIATEDCISNTVEFFNQSGHESTSDSSSTAHHVVYNWYGVNIT